jgi:hypothetical protein
MTTMRRFNRPASLAAALLGLCAMAGCSSLPSLPSVSMPEPWVKPYEREHLADPQMKFSRFALADKHREHVHEVREGARGATGVQGGGCGCN